VTPPAYLQSKLPVALILVPPVVEEGAAEVAGTAVVAGAREVGAAEVAGAPSTLMN